MSKIFINTITHYFVDIENRPNNNSLNKYVNLLKILAYNKNNIFLCRPKYINSRIVFN